MKSTKTILIACATLVIMAGSAFAQLSATNRDWAKGAVQFLMTDEEQAAWKNVKTDAEAQAFIDLFWARRDPTPRTPVNEFREQVDKLIATANEKFGEGRRQGSMTERGRVFVVLGGPTEPIKQFKPSTTTAEGQEASAPYALRQVWNYDASKMHGLIPESLEIAFIDRFGNGTFAMERPRDVNPALHAAAAKYIVSPDLKEVPKQVPAPAPQALPKPTTPAPAAAIGEFKTPALKTAVEEFKAAATNPYKKIGMTYTPLVTPTGDYYVPVQLYIPKAAGLTADQVTTFFGLVEDKAGNTVAIFEEPATLSSSKGDLYFDKSLNLKPGSYKATLGLSGKDGKPVVMTTGPLELMTLSKDVAGISPMIISTDVHETEKAALAGAPYAFGQVKIVPKGDDVITNKDELTYFVEVLNPGIDETTKLPKLQVKLDLVGAGTKQKPGRTISAPITDASALPLTGTPGAGTYAVLSTIPLGEMKNPIPAGDYTLKVKIYDQVTKQSWTTERSFKVVAAQ